MGRFITDTQNITSSSNGVNKISATKQMIAEVKNKISIPMYFYSIIVPQLGSYYDEYPVDFDNKIVVCCPLHDEDTPSCRYYVDTNSFYCFGCQKGGDVVALHRYFAEKLNGTRPDYDEAISFLYQYFIKGRESQTFIDETKQKLPTTNERLNSDADIVKFNIYRFNLEKSISFDDKLKMEIKLQLWELLDNIDCLLSHNKIKANEAETFIKQRVKELITMDSYYRQIRPVSRSES